MAVAAAPALARLTLVTVSVPRRPLTLNSVPAKMTAWPYVLVRSVAVTVSGAGRMSNAALVAPMSPPLDAPRVYVPIWSTLNPLNVATPLMAATVSVPPRVGPAGARTSVTEALLSVTTSPPASRIWTVTAGLIVDRYSVSDGCCWKARWVARFQVTVLSTDVEAVLALPAISVATPAAMLAMTVPEMVIPVTATLNVVGPPLTVPVLTPPDVPVIVTPPVENPLTVSLNTAVKLIGLAFVGSTWPTAWLMVTVGAVRSMVTAGPSVTAFGLPTTSVTALTRSRRITVP